MSVTGEHPRRLPTTAGRILGGFEPGVGFIGLGDMGGRIAQRILAAGFPLTVYDTSADACHKLRERGATVAEQAELVGRRCGVVSICVVDDTQLREVIGQLRRELRPGSVVLVHSSVLPETVIEVAQRPRDHRRCGDRCAGQRLTSRRGCRDADGNGRGRLGHAREASAAARHVRRERRAGRVKWARVRPSRSPTTSCFI